MDMNKFFEENGKIRISDYKVTVKHKTDDYLLAANPEEQDSYFEYWYCAKESDIPNKSLESFENDYIAKHKLLSVESAEELDNSDVAWIEGIELPKQTVLSDYVTELINMGEDGYKLSLASATENYLLDLDCRLSMIELGV